MARDKIIFSGRERIGRRVRVRTCAAAASYHMYPYVCTYIWYPYIYDGHSKSLQSEEEVSCHSQKLNAVECC